MQKRYRLTLFMCAGLIACVLGSNVYGSKNGMIIRVPAPSAGHDERILKKTKKKGFVPAEVAARRLYQAWQKGNRSAALRVATSEAVNKLFQGKWRPMKPGKNFCQNRGNGMTCIYHDGKGGVLEMAIDGGVSVGGYNVTSVSLFSTAD